MTMCLGKEKLEHIMQCKVCQERMNYVLTGGTASKAVRTFKKIKKEEIRKRAEQTALTKINSIIAHHC